MNNPSRCNLFHEENVNINSIELEDLKEPFFNMRRESSHNTELKLSQSQEETFDDLTSPTFKSDSLPKKITPLNTSFNTRDSSREWVMKYQKDGVKLLANIHKKVVFSEELVDLSTSTTEDKSSMDCEELTSSCTTPKPLKTIKPLGSFFNRSQSLDWVKEYKQEGIEPLTNVEPDNVFGNDMKEELTTITPDGLPKVPSRTISTFSEFLVTLKGKENPQVPACMVTSLKNVRSGRMTSSDWVHQNLLDDDSDDKLLSEMFPELEEESDVEYKPLSKITQSSNKPQPLNIPRSVPSSADTIKKESKEGTKEKEYTDIDVLFGRGGRGNHHKGNKQYRSLVNSHKQQYRKTKDKQAKTAIARSIVHKINSTGGRFLMYNKAKSKWMEVPSVRARTKVSQALRE